MPRVGLQKGPEVAAHVRLAALPVSSKPSEATAIRCKGTVCHREASIPTPASIPSPKPASVSASVARSTGEVRALTEGPAGSSVPLLGVAVTFNLNAWFRSGSNS